MVRGHPREPEGCATAAVSEFGENVYLKLHILSQMTIIENCTVSQKNSSFKLFKSQVLSTFPLTPLPLSLRIRSFASVHILKVIIIEFHFLLCIIVSAISNFRTSFEQGQVIIKVHQCYVMHTPATLTVCLTSVTFGLSPTLSASLSLSCSATHVESISQESTNTTLVRVQPSLHPLIDT